LRYDGTDTRFPSPFDTAISQHAAPISRPRTRRSSALSTKTRPIIIEAVSVEGIDDREDHRIEPERALDPAEISDGETRPVYAGGKWHDTRFTAATGSAPA
jgi:5-oxoprolinase (ATP-hydrolysing)